jgi:ADP-heptose:LPS heptosyltransferase
VNASTSAAIERESVRVTRIAAYPTHSRPRVARRAAISVIPQPSLAWPVTPQPSLRARGAADRVLIIRLGAIGDVVRTLPAASALRGALPGAHLAWLVEPASRSAVEGQPWVDEVLVFPRDEIMAAARRGRLLASLRATAGSVASLRRRRFDLVLDFHSILKSGLLARASGATVRVAYARPFGREGAWLFAQQRVRVTPRRISRFERNRALVDFVAPHARAAARPFRVDPEARARIAVQLDAAAPVALQPGTSAETPHKRWPAARYAAVARALRDEIGVASIVLAGPTPGERALAESIAAASDGAATPAPATASLGDLAALLEGCRLYVGGDTGPMHVASLVGTPVVQILGPTDPIENAPWIETPSRSVRVPVACSPCRRGCAAAPCMLRVAPDAVVAAARALLAGDPRGC